MSGATGSRVTSNLRRSRNGIERREHVPRRTASNGNISGDNTRRLKIAEYSRVLFVVRAFLSSFLDLCLVCPLFLPNAFSLARSFCLLLSPFCFVCPLLLAFVYLASQRLRGCSLVLFLTENGIAARTHLFFTRTFPVNHLSRLLHQVVFIS